MVTTAKPTADGHCPEMDVDADADPITASYNVYLNPALPFGRRLLVLQQPNRSNDEPSAEPGAPPAQPRPQPRELRLKSDSGMVEVDVTLDTNVAYDREKGLRWGRALKSSMAAKNGGSHGLAGGFGFGAVQQRAGRGKKGGDAAGDADDEGGAGGLGGGYLDWNDAVRQDKVLRTQTLGGQYPDADEVQYMVGVFQDKDLHITPVSSLVLLRPQLHQIDAAMQQERSAVSAASSSAKEAAGAGSASAARAIHMTIKTTSDGDAVTTETMADRLRFVQSEPWRKLPYTDENVEAAWEVYNDSLFLKTVSASEGAADDATPTADAQPGLQPERTIPQFDSKWDGKRLLEAVSGISKPDPEPAPVAAKPEPKTEKLPELVAESKRQRALPRGGSAAAAGPNRRRPRLPHPRLTSIDPSPACFLS